MYALSVKNVCRPSVCVTSVNILAATLKRLHLLYLSSLTRTGSFLRTHPKVYMKTSSHSKGSAANGSIQAREHVAMCCSQQAFSEKTWRHISRQLTTHCRMSRRIFSRKNISIRYVASRSRLVWSEEESGYKNRYDIQITIKKHLRARLQNTSFSEKKDWIRTCPLFPFPSRYTLTDTEKCHAHIDTLGKQVWLFRPPIGSPSTVEGSLLIGCSDAWMEGLLCKRSTLASRFYDCPQAILTRPWLASIAQGQLSSSSVLVDYQWLYSRPQRSRVYFWNRTYSFQSRSESKPARNNVLSSAFLKMHQATSFSNLGSLSRHMAILLDFSACLSKTPKYLSSMSTFGGLPLSHCATSSRLFPVKGEVKEGPMGVRVPIWPVPSGFRCGASR